MVDQLCLPRPRGRFYDELDPRLVEAREDFIDAKKTVEKYEEEIKYYQQLFAIAKQKYMRPQNFTDRDEAKEEMSEARYYINLKTTWLENYKIPKYEQAVRYLDYVENQLETELGPP